MNKRKLKPPLIELTTEIEVPRLAIDERPTWSPFVRVQGRWRLDAFGRYWSPRTLAALTLLKVGAAWALWRLLKI